MLIFLILGQAGNSNPVQIAPQDRALIHLLLIVAILGIGLLMVIGLIAAWRNHIQRQREIEQEHEERDNDLPRPDAWATAAQRIGPEDADPDEAHVSPYLAEDEPEDDRLNEDTDEDDDDDDFPFRDQEDGDDDDDGPIGRS